MQSSSWAPEHSEALRELVTRGMSYSEAVHAINTRFGTAYSRNAAISRSKRMGLSAPARPARPKPVLRAKKFPKTALRTSREHRADDATAKPSPPDRPEPVQLRCVGIQPRLLSLVELEADDCRYPYGGDKEGEVIAFCGHPRLPGTSYCASHFRLTCDSGPTIERSEGPVVLRLVEAA